jgi:phosphatidylserine/phosphatidylglycerophosphate/cardiolipin synthase-like enzyme
MPISIHTHTATHRFSNSLKTAVRLLALSTIFMCGALSTPTAYAKSTEALVIDALINQFKTMTAKAPTSTEEEFGFSPEGSARALILKLIHSTTKTLDVMAYSFTSVEITDAIIVAIGRGVTVRLIVDQRSNLSEDRIGASEKALTRLVKAGAKVRTIKKYAIHHDKIMISDGKHLESGSFNFSAAAHSSNSENVSVRWNNPKAAAIFTEHFLSRWNQGQVFLGAF